MRVCWRPPAWAVGVGACAPVLRWGTRLCSRSSRGDRWEGGQVTLNIPSAPATEQPLTPSITSTHSLEHTIWPCILSQDDFRHTYSTTAHHHTVSPGQKQDSERSKSMLHFMHKTQGFDNDQNFISFAELRRRTPMTFILWQKTLIQQCFDFWVNYTFKEEI